MSDDEKEILIYIAGPYTKGDVVLNIRRAIDAADALYESGLYPVVPHLTHFWHFVSPKTYDDWCDIDLPVLKRCDGVLRLSGESAGADNETKVAKEKGIPVLYSIHDVLHHFNK